MKAIVIYTEDWANYEYHGTTIWNVIAITDEELAQIDPNDIVSGKEQYAIVDLQQARIEIKNVLKWGE